MYIERPMMARRRGRRTALPPAVKLTLPLPFLAGTEEGKEDSEVVGWEDCAVLRVLLNLRWMMPVFLAVSEMSIQPEWDKWRYMES